MQCYEEKLLTLLLEKYRSSKKDSGTGCVRRRTQLDPVKLYKKYRDNDADIRQLEAVKEAVGPGVCRGWLTLGRQGFSDEISKIYLVDEKVAEIEAYLSQKYGYVTKADKLAYLKNLCARYNGKNEVLDAECAKLQASLAANKIPKDYGQLEPVWQALAFIVANKRFLYLREVSMLLYGSSKYFEENTLQQVCQLLRDFYRAPCSEQELPDEILQRFNIVREEPRLYIKGDVQLDYGDRILDIGATRDGVGVSLRHLPDKILIHAARVMTVENWTSYQRSQQADTVYIYLGGYANRWQRAFLQQLYKDNRDVLYVHFGDIDAGGLYIHEHLCRITGISFAMHRMSVAELKDARFAACLQSLSDNDRNRLASLTKQEGYCALAEYMLAHNVKLEQEIISLQESSQLV